MRFSIRLKVSAFTCCATLLVGGTISLYSVYHWRQQVFAAFATEVREIASVISEALVDDLYFLDLRSMRHRLRSLRANRNVRYIYVTDKQGRVLVDGTAENRLRNQKLTDAVSERMLLAKGWTSQVEDGVFKIGGPIFTPDGGRIGHLHVGFSLDATYRIIQDTTLTSLYITFACLGIGVLLAYVVATHFSRPIWSMVNVARQIGAGRLGTRIEIERNDELGTLAESINQMAGQLQRQLHRLAALHDVNVAITSTLDPKTVLELLVEKIDAILPYECIPAVRLLNKENGELERVAYKTFNESEWNTRVFRPGRGLAGVVFATKAPLAVLNVQTDPRRQNPEAARKRGLVSYLGIPLIAKGEVMGILTIYTRKEHRFGAEEIEFLTTLAGRAAVAIHNAQLYEQVRSGQDQLRTLSHRLAEAQESERRTISRELHDEIGQGLTALKLNLDMSLRTPPHVARANLTEAQGLANELIGRVRDLSLRLRPAMLDDLGLLPTLVWHCKRYGARTQVRIHLEHGGLERRFPQEVATAAYRIVQEALTNVVRHSGAAEVVVRLWGNEDSLSIDVEDQGAGFDLHSLRSAGSTSGLSGMRERASSLGGQLTVESSPGKGTRITAILPLVQDEQEAAMAGQEANVQ
jgi:signal transduction histidine kinase/HAMP domain-containing protein